MSVDAVCAHAQKVVTSFVVLHGKLETGLNKSVPIYAIPQSKKPGSLERALCSGTPRGDVRGSDSFERLRRD